MGTSYSPRVITNGLSLYWDAANYKSYPGSGTGVVDLSQRRLNGTITNVTYSNKAFVFNGTTAYATHSSPVLTTSNTEASFFLWVNPVNGGVLLNILGQETPGISYHHSAIDITGGGVVSMSLWHGSLSNKVTSSALALNQWYNIGFTYIGTTLTGYLNGQDIGTATLTWNKNSVMHIGLCAVDATFMGSGLAGNCSIASVAVYDRALSLVEVQQNFNALRGRFGV
jgi:Concanavalin A-like lectin/glucanases superfamily